MKINIFETFAGIGSQSKALNNLKKKYKDFDFEVAYLSEWYIEAIIAYSAIHNNQKSKKYLEYYNENINIIKDFLKTKNFSSNSKDPIKDILKFKEEKLRKIYASVKINNNLVDITTINGEKLKRKIDLLTYSFPCQDLSIAGKGLGMERNSNTRSGLLWHIERILSELNSFKNLPKYLLMENVTAIKNSKHIKNLEEFKIILKKMGYTSKDFILSASDFGLPQDRKRYFLISKLEDSNFDIFPKTKILIKKFKDYLKVDEMKVSNRNEIYIKSIKNKIKLEKLENPLSIKFKNLGVYPTFNQANIVTGIERKTISTITFSGENSRQRVLIKENNKFIVKQLGPRENVLLMGFDKSDFNKMKRADISNEKIRGLAGNSIAVNILEAIFEELFILK
ncbi:DNA (cytosine-5-)-methyltransferase [Spiroplasma endosymbiont of Cantharis lateralis]|uniref:DNA (cytosine-5-)-methyltransferase n=1 Tax=Spiroplasma endosymbiont of Cantharis lateralis TaxID=3066277 RepID=UPI00313C42F8